MDKDKFIIEIEKLIKAEDSFSKTNESLGDIFGADSIAENKFLNYFYDMRNVAIEYLSKLVGDTGEWILWYMDEVRNSNKPLEVSIGNKEYVCETVEDLYNIIKDYNE